MAHYFCKECDFSFGGSVGNCPKCWQHCEKEDSKSTVSGTAILLGALVLSFVLFWFMR
jgi:uncharacterized paraquat-inducible protein A